MGFPERVVLLRSDNNIVVDTPNRRVRDLLVPHLQYDEKIFYRGREAAVRRKNGQSVVETQTWDCYALDHRDRIATSYGFLQRIRGVLAERGCQTVVRWATQEEADAYKARVAAVYTPDWTRIERLIEEGFQYRLQQEEALRLVATKPNGRIDCPPGWGKGTLIMLACMLFPKAKIDVTTKNVAVLHQRIYPELCLNLPSVGIVGGGKKEKGHRVMCYTADSLHHGRPDADFVFVDEGHQAGADKFSDSMGIYSKARVWMFSASWNMRTDNKDMRCEAMAGPIRLKVKYSEAEDAGNIVPIKVVWKAVNMDVNPCAGERPDDKKKHGIWRNDYRNQLIAADARLYPRDIQTLIVVETLEHAMELKNFLPEFKVVYSSRRMKENDEAWFRTTYPETFKEMSPARLQNLVRMFENNKLKKVIVTPCWNVGVNFKYLQVLIRGDGGGSEINDTQIPGRASRVNDKINKPYAILHDYRDNFDSGFRRKAKGREAHYVNQGWEQIDAARQKSALQTLLKFGGV